MLPEFHSRLEKKGRGRGIAEKKHGGTFKLTPNTGRKRETEEKMLQARTNFNCFQKVGFFVPHFSSSFSRLRHVFLATDRPTVAPN